MVGGVRKQGRVEGKRYVVADGGNDAVVGGAITRVDDIAGLGWAVKGVDEVEWLGEAPGGGLSESVCPWGNAGQV